MPAVKYKPSADCAYTQLISKIKGVPIITAEQTTSSTSNQQKTETKAKTNVEVKKISSGLMLAQYYNSDSEDENDNEDSNGCEMDMKPSLNNEHPNKNSQMNSSTIPISDENSIPPGIQLPPLELRIIIDKTASYVLKNGKDFEEILRAKNDQRFTFLQYKDPYHKYYTFKVTGAVCPDPVEVYNQGHIKSVGKFEKYILLNGKSSLTFLFFQLQFHFQ